MSGAGAMLSSRPNMKRMKQPLLHPRLPLCARRACAWPRAVATGCWCRSSPGPVITTACWRISRPPLAPSAALSGSGPIPTWPAWRLTSLTGAACVICWFLALRPQAPQGRVSDRKSTRLNSSHVAISYAVFCLKKKKAGDKEGITKDELKKKKEEEKKKEIDKEKQYAVTTRKGTGEERNEEIKQ